jgi:hypothetical protein
MLQVSACDAAHQRVSVQAGPGPSLEMSEAEFLLELLVCLLTDPARLDGGRQRPQRRVHRPVAQIVFPLTT